MSTEQVGSEAIEGGDASSIESSEPLLGLSQNWVLLIVFASVAFLCWLVYLLQAILTPFLAGAAVAYLGDPLADKLEAKGLGRTTAVVVVFTGFTLIFVAALFIFVPLLFQQLQVMWQKLPLLLSWVQDQALPKLMHWVGMDAQVFDLSQVKDTLINSWGKVGGVAGSFAKRATDSGLALAGFVANVTLIPVVSFYLLKDWDVITEKVQRSLPRRVESRVVSLAQECNEVIASFVRGQLMVMIALGLLYGIGLAIVGVEFALLIGMVAGLASIVPYMGFAVGIAIALVVSFIQFQDWLHPVMVVGVFAIGQTLEGTVLTPMLVGDKIGLHPVAVIFAVLAGAQLFGFVGMLLALPVAAVILVVLRKLYLHYLASPWYGATGNIESAPAQVE